MPNIKQKSASRRNQGFRNGTLKDKQVKYKVGIDIMPEILYAPSKPKREKIPGPSRKTTKSREQQGNKNKSFQEGEKEKCIR